MQFNSLATLISYVITLLGLHLKVLFVRGRLSAIKIQLELELIHLFYSEIPLPFPNSSYLLEPSSPMANAEMRFLRLCNNLNQAIGLQ